MGVFSNIRTSHRISGLTFCIVGCTLFLVKFGVDQLMATRVFERSWSIYNYLIPNESLGLLDLPARDQIFYLTMVAVAIPFITIGLIVTSYRLKDAGLHLGLLVLFFLPFVNLLFFFILSLLKSIPDPVDPPFATIADNGSPIPIEYASMSPYAVGRIVPRQSAMSMFVSALVVAPIGPLLTTIGVLLLKDYGWGLFIGMPFAAGLLSSLLHGWREPRTLGSCLMTSLLASTFCLIATFLFAIEGALCLIFLVPLAMPVALMGSLVGYLIQSNRQARVGASSLFSILLFLPAIMVVERSIRDAPTVFAVTTSVDINAPPSQVWGNVVSFSEIPKPTEWFFSLGAAYPIRARIDGQGAGAIRYCEFSTGAFVEPIKVWDENRLLKFSVTQNPPPMKEWSLFKIHPPHLDNYLKSHGGQFRLIDLGNGKTRLEGTTWYQHTMWPEAYWRIWTDWSIHQIHLRVLNHVKSLSERTSPSGT